MGIDLSSIAKIGGGLAGAYFGGPIGAAVGSKVGEAAGNILGGDSSSNQVANNNPLNLFNGLMSGSNGSDDMLKNALNILA